MVKKYNKMRSDVLEPKTDVEIGHPLCVFYTPAVKSMTATGL